MVLKQYIVHKFTGMTILIALLGTILSPPVCAQWAEKDYNPNPMQKDFFLPLPGDGRLAFRPVVVVQNNVATAKRFIMGNENYSPVEYPREGCISGGFQHEKGKWVYYMSKYEVTRAQYNAVMNPKEPQETSKVPVTNISWFEGIEFCQKLSTWLLNNYPDVLPTEDGQKGCIRMPTEEEWEYACRGGALVDANFFDRESFIPDGEDVADYVQYYRVGDVETIQPIGFTQKPNPLGLFDMIGNAGEMCIDIFQLNNNYGRFGGFVVRGGTIRLSEDRIRSSFRQEYPFYDQRTKQPKNSSTIGLRVILTAPLFTSLQRKKEIDTVWEKVSLPKGGKLSLTFHQARKKLARMATKMSDPNLQKDIQAIRNSYKNIAREINRIERRDGESAFRIGSHLAGTIMLQMRKKKILVSFIQSLKQDNTTSKAYIAKSEKNLNKVKESIQANLNSYGYAVEILAKKYKNNKVIVKEAYKNVLQKMKMEDVQTQQRMLNTMYKHVTSFQQRVPKKWKEDLSAQN